jgi:hypothetical protein
MEGAIDWEAMGRTTYVLGKAMGPVGLRGVGGIGGAPLRGAGAHDVVVGRGKRAGAVRRLTAIGPTRRPDAVDGDVDPERECNRRVQETEDLLQREGPQHLIGTYLDQTSLSKTVESIFDVSTMIAEGRAAFRGMGGDGFALSLPPQHEQPVQNSAFVFHFDCKVWRKMCGDEDGAEGTGTGEGEEEVPPDVMPIGADPYEQMLEDAEQHVEGTLRSLNMTDRERCVCRAILYVYRQATSSARAEFFKKWGSDMLGGFYSWSVGPESPSKEIAMRAVKRIAQMWLDENPVMPDDAPSEDVLFFNQGCLTLSAMGIEHDQLREQLERHARRYDSRDLIKMDMGTPSTYCDTNNVPSFQKVTIGLIWTYFLKNNGLEEHIAAGMEQRRNGEFRNTGYPTTAAEVWRICENEVCMRANHHNDVNDLRNATGEDLDMDPGGSFVDQCYFVTHKVFTYTNWCHMELHPEEWVEERAFLLDHLRHTWETMEDPHICGEFIQSLRCFGDLETNNREVKDAVTFLIKGQDVASGGWQVAGADVSDFKNSYHATVCAVGALMKPRMEGIRRKEVIEKRERKSKRQRAAADAAAVENSASNPKPQTLSSKP